MNARLAAQRQKMPETTGGRDIQSLVIADIEERRRVGIQRYGTALQAHNGRDALLDAYQEVLDLACYLRQELEERDGPATRREPLAGPRTDEQK